MVFEACQNLAVLLIYIQIKNPLVVMLFIAGHSLSRKKGKNSKESQSKESKESKDNEDKDADDTQLFVQVFLFCNCV